MNIGKGESCVVLSKVASVPVSFNGKDLVVFGGNGVSIGISCRVPAASIAAIIAVVFARVVFCF